MKLMPKHGRWRLSLRTGSHLPNKPVESMQRRSWNNNNSEHKNGYSYLRR
jgi:hypothetical protein